MKAPRVDAFIPRKKPKRGLKSPLDNMPAIESPLTVSDNNDSRGSAFFPSKKEPAPLTHTTLEEKIEKYTTHLEPSLVKRIKVHASEQEMKDYQVVKNALLLYFEKFKKK